jgi:DNA polymerase III sliding clamp (beta) subunit (PCNA family)
MIKLKEALASDRVKYDTIQQGKNQQYTIEVEGRILNKVSAILDENTKLKQEIFKKVDQCNDDVEKIYKESQEEKLMFDTKMTNREAATKEWTMKLLEDNYDDFNRLLNAKSVEIENQTKTTLASMGPK